MPKAKSQLGVLCDTGFLIRLNKPADPLHAHARGYLKYLLEGGHTLYVSTIALAEYAVRDQIANLPLKYFRLVPFNVDHAQKAGDFARSVFEVRKTLPPSDDVSQRTIIPNDTKMFAQAEVMPVITHYLTADRESRKVYDLLSAKHSTSFQYLHLSTPCHQAFGELDFESGKSVF
jgi:predicted nucleic acid-binding protein